MRYQVIQILRLLLLGAFLFVSNTYAAKEILSEDVLAKGPLPEDKAFEFSFEQIDTENIALRWRIPEGYYLYKDKFIFEVEDHKVPIGTTFSDNFIVEEDPFFGKLEVFRQYAEATLQFRPREALQNVTLKATYQGCWDGGVCYPPIVKIVKLEKIASVVSAHTNSGAIESEKTDTVNMFGVLNNSLGQDEYMEYLRGSSLWLLVPLFYLAGLVLAFTPCVFPTIPLVSSIITRQSVGLTVARGFTLMLVFVLASALTYSALGVVAGLLGKNLQVLLQQTWVILLMSALFLVLAGSMFGLYVLQMPSYLQSKLSVLSGKQDRGTYIGLAAMGILSALIVGPCLTAPLAGVLIFIGSQGDPVLGGLVLFMLGLGMGTPLLALGAFSGKWLPRAGAWMEKINHFFGFALLLITVWMLDRIMDDSWVLLLYGSIFICLAVYLLQVAQSMLKAKVLFRAFAAILFIFGISQIIGFSLGSDNFWQPLKILNRVNQDTSQGGGRAETAETKSKVTVSSSKAFKQSMDIAKQTNQPVLVKFEADWCVACKEIEQEVFRSSLIEKKLEDWYLVNIDVTQISDDTLGLLKQFELAGPPAVFLFAAGSDKPDRKLIGNIRKEHLARLMDELN